jgi:bacillithiol system protein YtxJ
VSVRPFRAEDLDSLAAVPRLLLFKHSPRCGVSRWALEEVERLAADDVVPIAVVDVVAEAALAREIAARTGVRHQSPQVIYLEGGASRWDLSHGAVTADAVRRRLEGAPDRGESRSLS